MRKSFARIFLFLETAGLLDSRALYTIQYSIVQYNTEQDNAIHYTMSFLGNLSSPGLKTVLKIERYAVTWSLLSSCGSTRSDDIANSASKASIAGINAAGEGCAVVRLKIRDTSPSTETVRLLVMVPPFV